MRRKLTIIGSALAAVLLMAGVAVAQEDAAPEHGDRPGATLTATGDGTAVLEVDRGVVRIYVVGDIGIEGPSDLDIQIESWETGDVAGPAGGTSIELEDFAGMVTVRGTGYVVEIEGHMTFHGHGEGQARLDGTGLWKTKNDKGVWPAGLNFPA